MRLAVAVMLAVLVGASSAGPGPATVHAKPHKRPNIVFILTDDLSSNLLAYMPHVRQMQRDGMTFTNYFVTDSLCCPSRASILTGRYPHNHGVLTNTWPIGGYAVFRRTGDQRTTFATSLKAGGYRTSLMGKYLNGYLAQNTPPPGWSDWQGFEGGYKGFNYWMSANGRMAHYGRARRAYVTDLLRRKGKAFISRAISSRQPFMIELATFAPHRPATPAPRDSHNFPGLQAPRDAQFDVEPQNAPRWLRDRPPLTDVEKAALDNEFRKRAQSVQAVDEMVGQIRRQLKQRHEAGNTYVIFSSDNGYHLGERRLLAGKMTAYDSDIRVPLVVVGPGVEPGSVTHELAENIDLAPTFMRMAKVPVPATVDGQSLVSLLHGTVPYNWRDEVLIEHHHPLSPIGDPDAQLKTSGDPPSYEALRTADMLYVEYADGEREWYDLRTDPDEMNNLYDRLDDGSRQMLHNRLVALEDCHGVSCRRAATPGG